MEPLSFVAGFIVGVAIYVVVKALWIGAEAERKADDGQGEG